MCAKFWLHHQCHEIMRSLVIAAYGISKLLVDNMWYWYTTVGSRYLVEGHLTLVGLKIAQGVYCVRSIDGYRRVKSCALKPLAYRQTQHVQVTGNKLCLASTLR